MKTFNGHTNWTYWNVSLWILNDAELYWFASDLLARHSRRDAAKAFVQAMQQKQPKTPDGARYTIANVFEAMSGL